MLFLSLFKLMRTFSFHATFDGLTNGTANGPQLGDISASASHEEPVPGGEQVGLRAAPGTALHRGLRQYRGRLPQQPYNARARLRSFSSPIRIS